MGGDDYEREREDSGERDEGSGAFLFECFGVEIEEMGAGRLGEVEHNVLLQTNQERTVGDCWEPSSPFEQPSSCAPQACLEVVQN